MASDAAPHLELPPDDGPGPAAERLVRLREVSAELEAIFGQAAQLPVAAPRAQAQVPGRRAALVGTPRQLNLASVGVVSAAALAGVAIGSLLARVPQFAPAPVAIGSLLAHIPQFVRTPSPAASDQQPEPASLVSLPVQALPPLQEPQAVDASLVTPPAPTTLAPAALKPKPRAVHAHVRTAHPPRASHACCFSYAQVEAADRRLRDAYDEAVRTGVPRGEIMAARDRWSAARRRATHDPVGLVADYRDIADDLNRASDRASSPPPPRTYAREDAHEGSGLFQPRYAAWWR